MSSLELQPIILAAGRGSRMSDITAKIPKALLPVGNLPMIFYPIHMLDKYGFEGKKLQPGFSQFFFIFMNMNIFGLKNAVSSD